MMGIWNEKIFGRTIQATVSELSPQVLDRLNSVQARICSSIAIIWAKPNGISCGCSEAGNEPRTWSDQRYNTERL
jgi:hypothetical protein